MAYASVNEVVGDFKNLDVTKNTLVSKADIERFIAEADALINSYVGMRYVVPITADTSSVTLMRLYSITLVADRIKKILEVRQTTNTAANQDVRGAFSTRDVIAALKAIKEGELLLSGATLVTGASGYFYSDNAANARTPVFKKDDEQW